MSEPSNHAAALIDTVCDRLRGAIDILDLLRGQLEPQDNRVRAVVEHVLGEQIVTLEDELLPDVTGQPALPLCIMAVNLGGW